MICCVWHWAQVIRYVVFLMPCPPRGGFDAQRTYCRHHFAMGHLYFQFRCRSFAEEPQRTPKVTARDFRLLRPVCAVLEFSGGSSFTALLNAQTRKVAVTVNWKNPYAEPSGRWLKGNLHAHSAQGSPCSDIPLSDLLQAYKARGYDFLSVSDHMTVTRPECDGLTLLPGLEWNSRIGFMPNGAVTYQDHLGVYGSHDLLEQCIPLKDRDSVFRAVDGEECFVVANHPNWTEHGHYDFNILLRIAGRIDGMEIFNALIESEEGSAYAVAEWDRLLAAGHRVLGLASDDAHDAPHVGCAWIMADCADNTSTAVLNAIRQGRFYCSSGVSIASLKRDGDVVSIVLEEEMRIDVIGRAGKLIARHVGTGAAFSFNTVDTPYVRFHVMDRNWGQAWSQPFFRG